MKCSEKDCQMIKGDSQNYEQTGKYPANNFFSFEGKTYCNKHILIVASPKCSKCEKPKTIKNNVFVCEIHDN